MATSINVLILSGRAHNLLRRNGISDLQQLRNSLQALPLLHGCGAAVLAEVLGSLALYDERLAQ